MASIPVRVHAFTGAALLALAAPLALLAALRIGPLPADVHLFALLAGLTLVAQAIAFAYLPSFAKREVVLDGMASYAGPILLPAATLGAALRLDGVRLAAPTLALALFGIILLGSALFGKRWRNGIPFWRVEGPFQKGDIAAAATLACAALWSIAAGAVAMVRPSLLALVWPGALALLALGALAHYVPRNRGRPILLVVFAIGVLGFQVGLAARILGFPQALPLALGLPLAGLALAPPAATKPAGARMREAAPLLAAAVPFSALAVGLALAGRGVPFAFAAYYALLAAVALGLAGLALLTLPVVFNQRPARRWLWPLVASVLLGVPLLAIGFLTRLPRWPGALVLAAALLVWLVMMAPLRRPRREC